MVTGFDKIFTNLASSNYNESQLLGSKFYWILIYKIITRMIKVNSFSLIEAIFGYFMFQLGREETQFCKKIAKNHFLLLLMNYRRYHCVSFVYINYRVKKYFIVTKYEDVRAWQSCGGNFRTPCNILPSKSHHVFLATARSKILQVIAANLFKQTF